MMHNMTVTLIALVIGIATIEASIVSTQDWYDNACGANCTQYLSTGYTASSWNYDYTQGQNGNPCAACTTGSKCGPYCWDKISGTNHCGNSSQTPIDLSFSKATEDNSIEFPTLLTTKDADGCNEFNMFGDDHAFEVSVHDAECENLYAEYGGEEYTFLQLHFHYPSEHTFNGYHSAEVHFVHKNVDATKYFVLGVFLDVVDGVTNHPFLKSLYDIYIDQGASTINGEPDDTDSKWSDEYEIENFKDQNTGLKFNPYRDFLPSNPAFFHYTGSLTTFPCTEGVEWFVYEEPLKIGAWDMAMFKAAVSSYTNTILETPGDITDLNSNRPIQPLNGRTLYYSSGVEEEVETQNAADNDQHVMVATKVAVAAIVVGCLGCAIAMISLGFSLARMFAKEIIDNKGSVNA